MAAPPPSPELACHSACLSLLLFHLHSAVGAAAPDPAVALADLLAAIPALAPNDRRAIADTSSALRSRPDGPGHPDLLPLVPAEPHSVPLASPPPLVASLSPFLLHDTFVFELSFELRFDGSGQPHALSSEAFSQLRQASRSVEPAFTPTLGQCCILYLQTHDPSLAFAQACAAAIGPSDLRFRGEATLLGRPIWEFSSGRCAWHIWLDDPHHPIHQDVDGSYQQHLLNLLCCRAKMEFAARAGRHALEAGLRHYQAIETCAAQLASLENSTAPPSYPALSSWPPVKDPKPSQRTQSAQSAQFTQPTHSTLLPHSTLRAHSAQPTHSAYLTEDGQQRRRIAHLEELLSALPQYGLRLARCERDITTHRLTFSTNAVNAAQAARALWQEGDTFLRGFLEQEGSTWLQQLDHDGLVLRSGQRYTEQLINSLRAIVALDGQKLQMKLEREEKTRERTLQLTIFFVGAALSISGLAAATRPRPTTKLLATFFPHQRHLPAAWLWLGDIAIHFLIGLAAALLVLLLWWAWGQLRGRARGRSSRSAQS